jgi:hypothetical protein
MSTLMRDTATVGSALSAYDFCQEDISPITISPGDDARANWTRHSAT